jgi:Domain of Unknown Function with PDB structure (DUF3857)/Transglutaminase-like superfamily
MTNRSYFSRERWRQRSKSAGWRISRGALLGCVAAALVVSPPGKAASDAPAWMHALVSGPLPAYDEKTSAVVLYAEDVLAVQSNGKIKKITRRAYKILRPGGRRLGQQHFFYDAETKISGIHGWCIPAAGKDFEVKEKEMTDTGYRDVEGGELYTDIHAKVMNIPAAEPGNIIGYEVEQDYRPYVLGDEWFFQEMMPVREARYTLQLPPNWEYKAVWMNHEELAPAPSTTGQWQWTLKDIPEVKWEAEMPPWKGVAGLMVLSIIPPGGANRGFLTWKDMGAWYNGLTQGRRDASAEIKQQVAALTGSLKSPLAKMQALAGFLQNEVRYVGIWFGIGGFQPHAAREVFKHRFGDCKDKATLLSAMLKEVGIESYYVIIHTERGGVTPITPPHLGSFNHAILAIQLPEGLSDSSLVATLQHPRLGRILIFDPTDTFTPFGELRGDLQDNYGMLVTPDGGELIELPQLPAAKNGVQRTAKLTLDGQGNVRGDVHEVRVGDSARYQRHALRSVSQFADQIKPIESLMGHSLGTFQVTKATVTNLHENRLPFEYHWSFVATDYGKRAGELLLVRPRVFGVKSSDVLETKEPRKYAMELPGPSRDTDTFEITLPPEYAVDDLPAPVDAEYPFASYHSKTEVQGSVLRYTRTFEVKEVSIPVGKIDELRKLYRIIAGDERSTAVLKPSRPAAAKSN